MFDFEMTPFNSENIKAALNIMWKGMLAILIVIVLVVLITMLINFIVNRFEVKKAAKQAQDGQGADTDDSF